VQIAKASDVVVVVGGSNSNNTRELVGTCRRFCPRVHHVQTAADLQPGWFDGAETVGLTAGTSTPDITIDGVEHWLMEFGSHLEQHSEAAGRQNVAPANAVLVA
jgi:4-hydroxy-3-methylbut-2-enyl diphosphate reductase